MERCQRWFLKKLFYLPDYIESSILYIISGLSTISTLLHQKRLYFLGRIISLKKIPKIVFDIFMARLHTLDDNNLVAPQGFLDEIAHTCYCGEEYRFSLPIKSGNRLLIIEFSSLRGKPLQPLLLKSLLLISPCQLSPVASPANSGTYFN